MPEFSRNSVVINTKSTHKVNRAISHKLLADPNVSRLRVKEILEFSTGSIVFSKQQEPKSTNKVYKAIDGNEYYLPDPVMDIMEGEGVPDNAPAIHFVKDENNNVSLQFQFIFKRPNNASAKARLLTPIVEHSIIVWNDNNNDAQLELSDPSYFSEGDDAGYRYLVLVPREQVDSLVFAMKNHSSSITFKTSIQVKYKVQKEGASSTATRRRTSTRNPVVSDRLHVLQPVVPSATLSLVSGPSSGLLTRMPITSVATTAVTAPVSVSPIVSSEALTAVVDKKIAIEKFKFNPEIIEVLGSIAGTDTGTQNTIDRVKHMGQGFSLFFSGHADNEKHIYQALEEEEKPTYEFADKWQHTDFGVFSPASFPNRIYVMPHALRLSYNAETNLPDITPTLYLSEGDEPRVRLRLGVLPWYDLEKVTQLRDFLTLADPSSFMYPELITNFSARAVLRLNTQFSEGITTLNDIGEVDINFSSLLSLDLDVTLEFYKFVTTLLEGPVGLTGSLSVFLKKESEEGDEATPDFEDIESVLIPFSLKIDEIANPQIEVLPADNVSPERPVKVIVKNSGGHDLFFKKAMPHLLYEDPNSIVPLNMFQSEIKQNVPLSVSAGEAIELDINETETLQNSSWNSIDMVLTKYEMDIDPKDALQKTHDLMPPGDLSWELIVQVPPFLSDTPMAGIENVFAVMVSVEIEGRATMNLTLTPDNGEHKITLSPSLNEILEMDGGVDFLEYTYKTQTILSDRMLDWSQPISGRGSRIFVFPHIPSDGG